MSYLTVNERLIFQALTMLASSSMVKDLAKSFSKVAIDIWESFAKEEDKEKDKLNLLKVIK